MTLIKGRTNAEKAEYCRRMAEAAELRAKQLSDAERASIVAEYEGKTGVWPFRRKRRPTLPTTINAILRIRLDTNRDWNLAVKDNRWYIDQATMYASLAMLERGNVG